MALDVLGKKKGKEDNSLNSDIIKHYSFYCKDCVAYPDVNGSPRLLSNLGHERTNGSEIHIFLVDSFMLSIVH